MQEVQKRGQAGSLPMSTDGQMTTNIRQHANVWIIDFIGDLTKYADREVEEAYRQIPEADDLFALNFSQCEYINSAGIAVIISLITQARRKSQRVLAYGLNPHYRKLFYMVGLSDYVEIYEDEPETLEKAIKPPSQKPLMSS